MRGKEEQFFGSPEMELRLNINIGIAPENRKRIVNFLSTLLSSTQILAIKTFSFHWNMRGKLSAYLGATTKEQYDELVAAMNSIAERIRTLGYNVPDNFAHVMKLSDIDQLEYNQSAMLSELIRDNEKLATFIREQKELISSSHDEVSYHLLLERLKVHEKNVWTFRNLLER